MEGLPHKIKLKVGDDYQARSAALQSNVELNNVECFVRIICFLTKIESIVIHNTAKPLLKDAISELDSLASLDICFIGVIRAIFLPGELNVRNLIWHGFISPAEIDTNTYARISEVLYLRLSKCLNTETSNEIDSSLLETIDVIQTIHTRELFSEAVANLNGDLLLEILKSSSFIPQNMWSLVISAVDDFRDKMKCVSCLLKILPVLEHALRLQFARVNQSSHHAYPRKGCYYTTLGTDCFVHK